ncbi:MAG: hypothetical protein SX243_18240 [Acidobacteriota bacterium]|nr:hypothetical protein [Acidobacteriota bacterium]
MELPTEVMIHNAGLGLKGSNATLLRIDPQGYYEVNLKLGENRHRTLLPIQGTMVIHRQPEEEALPQAELEIER